MSEQFDTPRENSGRRSEDRGCTIHEKRMDAIDQQIAGNKGWLKGSAVLITVVGFVLSVFCTNILVRLGSIADLLTDYKVQLKQHEMDITGLKGDVKEIKDRHVFEDQRQFSIRSTR